ncbi:MAG: DNA polymerase [Dehalococcoidia bacterium]
MHDVYWTARLLPHLLQDAKDMGQFQWWEEYGTPFQHAVLDMSQRGILLDKTALKEYKAQVRTELRETDKRIREAADKAEFTYTDKFPNSRDQMAVFLFDVIGLKPTKRTAKKGRGSTDQESLTRVLRDLRKKDEPHRWLLFDVFHRSRLNTILTRYLNLEAEEDGRVRPTIKMAHVKTWRLAYANPALQQWPPEARHIFVAKPGHVLLQADYDQLESRILSYYADDRPSITVFEQGGDPHLSNAQDLFQEVSEENPTPARNYAKTWLYRQMYGGTAASGDKKLYCPCPKCAKHMPSTLALKPREAALAEERWHARHPAVKLWQAEVERDVRSTHRFPLLLGGYRYISSPWTRDLAREMKNIPMQSGVARVMIRAQNTLHHRYKAPIVLQHHDSFVLEVPEDAVQDWDAIVRSEMEMPVQIGKHEVVIPVTVKCGCNWGRYHKDTNPEGLRAT